MFYVYILRTDKNTLYVGQTNDLEKRLSQHRAHKRGAKYLNGFSEMHVIYTETFSTRSEALKREWQLKLLTHDEKEKLIANHHN